MDPESERVETELLAIAVQTGELESFNQLYDRVAPAVTAWASFRIPGRLKSLVSPEDLVQEVWFRAFERISNFDPKRPFRAWIFGFANRVLREILRHKPLSTSGQADGGYDFAEVPAETTTIVLKAARNEGVMALLAVFRDVDDGDRELIALRGIEGLPFEEVAQRLGVSAAVVRKRWERLKRRLNEKEPPEGLLIG